MLKLICKAYRSNDPHRKGLGSLKPVLWCLAASCLFLAASKVAPAQSPSNVTQVEEDWEIVIGQPDVDSTAPQIISIISPINGTNAEYAAVEFNHSTQPDYTDGGIQFQRWYGNALQRYRAKHTNLLLQTEGETIRYTMSMQLNNGSLRFNLINGTSTTWGDFGGDATQWRSTAIVAYSNLDSYSPDHSVNASRVGYAANRVKKFVLKRVRYYSNGELVHTDTTERIAHESVEAAVQ